MGTWLEVNVQTQSRAQAMVATEATLQAVVEADLRLSTWRDDSELAAVNHLGATRDIEVSPLLLLDLSEALRWSRLTDGAFNPGIGALVSAWNLRGSGTLPDEIELELAIANSRITNTILKGGHVRFRRPGFRFEEGGFGKGAALRDALEAAELKGSTCTILDFGGQIAIGGSCDPITIGIAAPGDRHQEIAALELTQGSAATSGLSERSFIIDGKVFGHILDPRTGMPIENWGSITLVADDPLAADCLSTALYVMGPEAGAAWAASQPEVEALFVERSEAHIRLTATEGLRGRLKPLAGHEVRWIKDAVALEGRQPNSTPRVADNSATQR